MHFDTFINVSCDIGEISLKIFISIVSLPRSLMVASSKSKKSEREMWRVVHIRYRV